MPLRRAFSSGKAALLDNFSFSEFFFGAYLNPRATISIGWQNAIIPLRGRLPAGWTRQPGQPVAPNLALLSSTLAVLTATIFLAISGYSLPKIVPRKYYFILKSLTF
jgi:hypothetical protein